MRLSKPVPSGSLNVLMLNTYQTGGGAGRVGEALADGLRRTGDRVVSFVSHNAAGDPNCRKAGHWRERRLANLLSSSGFTDLGCLSSFLWRCREEYASADLLHLHNLHGDYLSIAALPLLGFDKPVVWTLHDFWPMTGNCTTPRGCVRWRGACGNCPLVSVHPMGPVDRSSFYRRIKPKLIVAAHPLLVTPSRWLAARVRQVRELGALPLRVIPNPIPCDVFVPSGDRAGLRRHFGLRSDHPTVVIVGSTWADKLKGAGHAIAALQRARECVRNLQALIIGTGSDRLLAAGGVPGTARPFVQSREALARAYACADLCLFPSLAENYPLTTLEAMACGTPVVAYDVGGVDEQIQNLKTGLLARDGHSAELAGGVIRLASDVAAARQMGLAAREFVRRTCDVSVVRDQYREVYADAIRAWRRRHPRRSPRYRRGRLARCISRAAGWEIAGATSSGEPFYARQPALGGVS